MAFIFNIILEVLETRPETNKKQKWHPNKKRSEIMFVDYIILNVEYCKGYTHRKNCLELINKFSKVAGHIINIQKSVVFLLYTSNEFSEEEIQTIQVIIASKRTQYVGINLTKGAKGLVPCSRLEAA